VRVYQGSKPYFFTERQPFRSLDGTIAAKLTDDLVGGNSASLIAYLKGIIDLLSISHVSPL